MRLIPYLIVGLFCATVFFSSCKKDYDPGETLTKNASNGWWATYGIGGTPFYGPVFFATYNVAGNTDSIWLDDLQNFWAFKVKVKVNLADLTFSGTDLVNTYFDDTVRVQNGQIFRSAGHSASGAITDSIYMELLFSDDSPAYGNVYQLSGTARTGFSEDEY